MLVLSLVSTTAEDLSGIQMVRTSHHAIEHPPCTVSTSAARAGHGLVATFLTANTWMVLQGNAR